MIGCAFMSVVVAAKRTSSGDCDAGSENNAVSLTFAIIALDAVPAVSAGAVRGVTVTASLCDLTDAADAPLVTVTGPDVASTSTSAKPEIWNSLTAKPPATRGLMKSTPVGPTIDRFGYVVAPVCGSWACVPSNGL